MKDSNDKYKMFKNFMHNELGITKEDIRTWVKESVKEEARRLVDNEFEHFSPRDIVRGLMLEDMYWGNKQIQGDCRKILMDALMKKINLTIKE